MSMYTAEDILNFVEEENVKFIRLAFFDVFGVQKNIAIQPSELSRAFKEGISFDGSAIAGFSDEANSDLFLFPDPTTMSILPWRSMDGTVIRMYCDIRYPDNTPFCYDTRTLLKKAIQKAKEKNLHVDFGSEIEFYLFKQDEEGNNTYKPLDKAGYMDIAPEDKGENVRREICFTLADMGIEPEASHHEEGPGQNEIDFHYTSALMCADHVGTFKWVVKTVAYANGLIADFSPKPLKEEAGNGMHINISIDSEDKKDYSDAFMAGMMEHIEDITLFLNPVEDSYARFGKNKAPKYVTWSKQNRSQLIRIPATKGKKRLELRSPDPMCNPYLAYALLIYAGLDGIERNLVPEKPLDVNLFNADKEVCENLRTLPATLKEAKNKAKNSAFVRKYVPKNILEAYCK